VSNRKRYTNIRSVGTARSPGGSRRDARNSDADSNPLGIAVGVDDVEFPPLVAQSSGGALSDVVELNKRIKALQSTVNALLASLREGQVIDG
jgi:hypothetical protein